MSKESLRAAASFYSRLVAFGQRNNPNWTSVYPSYARPLPLGSSL
ncbi:hypothetical protein GQ600_20537 [Phytophthora cactorum]|nr:hypothetical protein GQ600_20537 [Phytophthora cactorum]